MGKPMSDELKLPAVFTDHMVLQREMPIPVWGWAKPGSTVSVELAGDRAEAIADANGEWMVRLSARGLGGPLELVVRSGGSTIRRSNILMGDVWVCSGQSNMEWTMEMIKDVSADIAAADFPQIRLFSVARKSSAKPLDDVNGKWVVCTPQTVATFSAVAFYMGRELHASQGVPIGLIATSWGGTVAEAWVPREALAASPRLAYFIDRIVAVEPAERTEPWEDPGNKGFGLGWADTNHDESEWKPMKLPTPWEWAGLPIDGAVWFRRTVDVPADWAGKDLELSLGAIDDFDTTYWNGQEIGQTGMEIEGWWMHPRKYVVPGSLVRPGRNVIAARVFDRMGSGGFVGKTEEMSLSRSGSSTGAISLAGEWLYRIELSLAPIGGIHPSPTTLWNGMVEPLVPFAIKGAAWYQGESNADRAVEYRDLLKVLIRSWRKEWGQGDFPFLIVQLANFRPRLDEPGESTRAELREAQAMALELPNTGLAVAIDIGEGDDIHPKNKLDVGRRLALAARRVAYGEDIAFSGPVYAGHTIEGNAIRVQFRYAKGLHARGGEPGRFAVAGDDGKFFWATAKIDGESVVVHSPQVSQPVAVRYAWEDNPPANLFNEAGLPMVPFRTDRK
jgi:sialate O-acetylesterase